MEDGRATRDQQTRKFGKTRQSFKQTQEKARVVEGVQRNNG